MSKKALVVIDIQNDITKHYRDIPPLIQAILCHQSSQRQKTAYKGTDLMLFSKPKFFSETLME